MFAKVLTLRDLWTARACRRIRIIAFLREEFLTLLPASGRAYVGMPPSMEPRSDRLH